jgi:cell wall-associated NlpC family hydrolase
MGTQQLNAQRSAFSRSEKPFSTISRMFLRDNVRDSLVELARSQVGTRYLLGAATPGTAFDCSGLVQWVMANFDMVMPRTSREQARLGIEIAKDPALLLPGDLLYFGRGRAVDHIGIYVGNGRYVHAARPGKGVVEAQLPTGSWARNWWKGARRLFTHEEEIATVTRTPISFTGT